MADKLFEFLFPDIKPPETKPLDINALIDQESKKYGLDKNIVNSLIIQESGGASDAVSPKGAIGVMQIMPYVGQAIANELGEEFNVEKLKDPETNIRYGTYLLGKNKQQYGSDALALAAYHGGPGAIRSDGTIDPNRNDGIIRTVDYVDTVLNRADANQEKEVVKQTIETDELYNFLDIKPIEQTEGQREQLAHEIPQPSPTVRQAEQILPVTPQEDVIPQLGVEPPTSTAVEIEELKQPETKRIEDVFKAGEAVEPIKHEKKTGFAEAMVRSVGKGTAELGLSIARIPQTASEIVIGLNNLLNKGVSKVVETATGGKVKEAFKPIPYESIPELIKLNEKDWDVKKVKEFIKNQEEAIKEATNEKGIVDNLREGNFDEAGKSLGIQAAAQIPLVASMFVGGLAGAGAKTLGKIAGATTASQKMDEYWDKVEQGISSQSPDVAVANAVVNGFIEGFGESLGTGKIISEAVEILGKTGTKEVAKRAMGNAVGQYVGKVMSAAGQEGTEEAIVGFSQAVSDKIFGDRPELTFLDAVKEGIESGLVGAFTSGATTGQLAGMAEISKPTEQVTPAEQIIPEKITEEEKQLSQRVRAEQKAKETEPPLEFTPKQEQMTPEIEKTINEAGLAQKELEDALKKEKKLRKKTPEEGIGLELENLQAIKKDFESTGLPPTKKAFKSYWENVSGEKITNEEARDKLKQVMGSEITEEEKLPEKPIEDSNGGLELKEKTIKEPEFEPKTQIIEKKEAKKEPEIIPGEVKPEVIEKPKEVKQEKKAAKIEGQEVNISPTEAQKKAGNYKKAHIKRNGMDISIENPTGSIRTGTDSDGETWSQEMKADYGYIKGTTGKDGDQVDTFIKPKSKEGGTVFVIDQVDPKTWKFDEVKVMLGYNSTKEARKKYLENYEKGWKGIGAITPIDIDGFKEWLEKGNSKKSFAGSQWGIGGRKNSFFNKERADRGSVDTDMFTDAGKGSPTVEKRDSEISIPRILSNSDTGGRQASSLKSVSDGVLTRAKTSSDLSKREAILAKGDSFIDRPGKVPQKVENDVLRPSSELEVTRSVVQAVPIDVMDNLTTFKGSPDKFFHDDTVFRSLSEFPVIASDIDKSVKTTFVGSPDVTSVVSQKQPPKDLSMKITHASSKNKSNLRKNIKPGTIQTYDKAVSNAFDKKDTKSISRLSSVVLAKSNTNLRKIFEEEQNVTLPDKNQKQFITDLVNKPKEKEYPHRYQIFAKSKNITPQEKESKSKEYTNWINDKWSQYDKEKGTKDQPKTKEINHDFDNWLRDEVLVEKAGGKPNVENQEDVIPVKKGQYAESLPEKESKKEKLIDIEDKTNDQQKLDNMVDTAKTSKAKGDRKNKQMKAVSAIENQIQHNPKPPKKTSGWLSGLEYGNFKAKEIATPMIKIRKTLEKAGVKDEKIYDKIDYAIDRARGAGSTSQLYVDENYKPIFNELNEKSPKERGIIARYLSQYLVAKRTKWHYDNKAKYEDAGINIGTANTIIDYIESGDNQYSDMIQNMAQQLWNYNKELVKIKHNAGIIDKDLLESLKEPYYVPFNRDVETGGKGVTTGKQKFTAVSTGIKRIKGTRTGHKVIDPIQLMIAHTHETIINAKRVEVAQNVIDIAEKNPELFDGLINMVAPKWFKAGTIEHRIEVDARLKDKIKDFADKIGIDIEIAMKLGKKRLGVFIEEDDLIRLLYGATESTAAHELGHALDSKDKRIRNLLMNSQFKDEMTLIADSRYEGEEVPLKYVRYVRQQDEKIAEFISMYLTNRPMLKQIAPMAYGEFEKFIAQDNLLKELKNIQPSNVQKMETYQENNYVMDTSIPPDEDVISLRREGKLVHYRVPIELAQAIKNLHPNQIPTLLKWSVAIPTRTLRFGAVIGNPDFFIPNVSRDQLDAAFNTKNIPFVDWFIGAKAFLGITKEGKELYKMYLRRGGGMDSPEAGITGHKSAYADVIYGSKAGEFIDPFYWKNRGVLRGTMDLSWYGVKTLFKPITYLCELSEMGTRLGVFNRNLKAIAKAKGIDLNNLNSADAQFAINQAVHAARQATLDFQRFGYSGKIPNEMIPFLNAAMEGLDRTVRSVAVPISKGKIPVRPIIFAGVMYGILAGLTAWNRREEEEYKKISSREKANNWIIMKGKGDGTYWKIPKGHITKLIVNPGQMTYEKMAGLSEKTGWGITVDMFMDVSPIDQSSILPVTAKLIVEPIANYNFYWNEQIEKPIYKSLPSGYRFKKSTSETLKTIGKALNISPIMMQHEINTALGGTGRNILWLTDWLLGYTGLQKPPHFDADNAIIVRRFNGKAEEWKRDAVDMIKTIDNRIVEIQKAGKGARIKRLKSIGFTNKEIAETISKSGDELKALQKKKVELKRAIGKINNIQNGVKIK